MPSQAELRFKLKADSAEGRTLIAQTKRGLKEMGDSAKKQSSRGKKSADQFGGALGSVKNIAAGLGLTFGALAIGQIIRKWAQATNEFESEFANVATLVDTSMVSVDGLKSGILGLGGSLGSSTDLTKGLYQALSAGVEPAEAVKFVGEAAKFAKAGLTDTNSAVDVLTTALNAYGLSADQVTDVSDTLFTTVKLGKTTADELAKSFGQVIAIAATTGVGFKELNAAVSTLTAGGINTSEAMTSLKAVISNIGQPSKQAADTAKDLGINFSIAGLKSKGFAGFLRELSAKTKGNVQAQKDLFGSVEAFNAIANLTSRSGIKTFNEAMEAQGNAAGANNEAFEKMNSTLSSQTTALWNNLTRIFVVANRTGVGLTGSLEDMNQSLEDGSGAARILASVFAFPLRAIDAFGEGIAELREQFAKMLVGVAKGLVKLREFGQGLGIFGDLSGSIELARQTVDRYKIEALDAAQAADKWRGRQADLVNTLRDFNDPARIATQDAEVLAKAQSKVKDAINETIDVLPPYDGRINGLTDTLEKDAEAARDLAIAHGQISSLAATGIIDLGTLGDRYGTLREQIDDGTAAVERAGKEYQNTTTGLKNFGGAASSVGGVITDQVSTIFTDLSKGVADSILKWQDMWGKFKDIATSFATAILRTIFENLFNPFLKGFQGLLSGGSFSIGSLFGGGGGGLSVATGSGSLGGILGAGAGAAGIGGLLGGGGATTLAGLAGPELLAGFGGVTGLGGGAAAGGGGFLGSLGGLATNPITLAVLGAIGGGLLLKNLFSDTPIQAGSKETLRDFGTKIPTGSIEKFLPTVGLNEGSFSGIRKDILSSPKFLEDILIPAAKANGEVDQLIASFSRLEAFGKTFDLSEPLRKAVESGDFEDFNTAWFDVFKNSRRLVDIFGNSLTSALFATSNATQQATEDLEGLGQGILDLARAAGVGEDGLDGFSRGFLGMQSSLEGIPEKTNDLFGRIAAFGQFLEAQGIPTLDAQNLAWEEFGGEIIGANNLMAKFGFEIPPFLQLLIDWGVANGFVALTADGMASAVDATAVAAENADREVRNLTEALKEAGGILNLPGGQIVGVADISPRGPVIPGGTFGRDEFLNPTPDQLKDPFFMIKRRQFFEDNPDQAIVTEAMASTQIPGGKSVVVQSGAIQINGNVVAEDLANLVAGALQDAIDRGVTVN